MGLTPPPKEIQGLTHTVGSEGFCAVAVFQHHRNCSRTNPFHIWKLRLEYVCTDDHPLLSCSCKLLHTCLFIQVVWNSV